MGLSMRSFDKQKSLDEVVTSSSDEVVPSSSDEPAVLP